MKVRTGEKHPFTNELATDCRFKVGELPSLDRAARSLIEAQDAYFERFPEQRKIARALLWDIEVDMDEYP